MLRKATFCLCIFFLHLGQLSAQEKYDEYKTYAAEDLRKDYDEVVKTLLAVHPGLFTFQSFTEFRYKATIARAQITDNMTDLDFYKIVSGLVNEVRCGHTFILPSLASIQYFKDKKINFPLSIKVVDGEAVVAGSFRESEQVFEGKRIRKVNGFSWKVLRDSLWHFIPSDGYIETRKDFLLGQNFEFFYRVFFGTPPVFDVVFEDTNAVLSPISYEEIAEGKVPAPAFDNVVGPDTAYLKLNTFSESKSFKKEVNKVFKTIKKTNSANLVIDLRENDGGSTENMIYVLAYLLDKPFTIFDTVRVRNKAALESFFVDKKQKKHYVNQIRYDTINRQYFWADKHNLAVHNPRKNNYDGTITILMGGGTFSSAVHFIACLLNDKDVVLRGEETGGFANHNNGGVIPKIVLPNTNLRLAVPLFQGKYHTEFDYEKGRGIFPNPELKSASKN